MYKKINLVLRSVTFLSLFFASTEAASEVKFRIGFESNKYHVYMTPDSVPEKDLLIASQITLVVPHDNEDKFSIDSIVSHIDGASWSEHSRIDAPVENTKASYISLGYRFFDTPPPFDWKQGQERKILSFSSSYGCDPDVKLIDNNDYFNDLPNSMNTNPSNNFINIGWSMSNVYTGNYGADIQCSEQDEICEPNGNDVYYLSKIQRLESLREVSPSYMHGRYDVTINNLKDKLTCKSLSL